MPSEDHHYVPQFLLRKWANKGKAKVWRRIPYRNELEGVDRATKEFGKITNLYSLDGVDESEVQILEKQVFREIDDKASVAMKKMLEGGNRALSNADKLYWAIFLNAFRFRHPQELEGLRKDVADLMEREFRAYPTNSNAETSKCPVEYWRDAFNSNNPAYLPNQHKKLMLDLIASEKLVEALLGMYWNVLSVEHSPNKLLITDRPFMRMSVGDGLPTWWAIPLCPTQLFVATERAHAKSIASISQNALVRVVNATLAGSASEFVCGSASRSFVERLFCPTEVTAVAFSDE